MSWEKVNMCDVGETWRYNSYRDVKETLWGGKAADVEGTARKRSISYFKYSLNDNHLVNELIMSF
jgi:hypothetical protein